jgi:hypothetical protein
MLGSVRPMSQSTPLACPHSIRAFQVVAQAAGSVGRREVEVRLLDQQPSAWLDGSGHPREHRRTVPGDLVQQGAAGHQVVRVVWQLGRRAGRPGMAGGGGRQVRRQAPRTSRSLTETMLHRGEHPEPLQKGAAVGLQLGRVSQGRGGGFLTCARPSSLDRAPGSRPQPARRRALRHCWLPVSRSSHRGSVEPPPVR